MKNNDLNIINKYESNLILGALDRRVHLRFCTQLSRSVRVICLLWIWSQPEVFHSCITSWGASQVMLVVKNLPAYTGEVKSREFDLWVEKIPGIRKWQPFQYSWGKSCGKRRLAGYSSWGCKESDMTEQLSTITLYMRPILALLSF